VVELQRITAQQKSENFNEIQKKEALLKKLSEIQKLSIMKEKSLMDLQVTSARQQTEIYNLQKETESQRIYYEEIIR
ncbi:hypothetical protein LSH36_27g00015, partial [Paralvinella palmiformis]